MFNHPFGLFALQLYARESVSAFCLRLQDNAGVDINILLWAAWLDSEGHDMSACDWRTIDNQMRGYRSVTQPIRFFRRGIRQYLARCPRLYATVKGWELWAEAREMQALYRVALSFGLGKAGQRAGGAGVDNVKKYLVYCQCEGELPRWLQVVTDTTSPPED